MTKRRSGARYLSVALGFAGLAPLVEATAQNYTTPSNSVPQVTIIGTTPMPGTGWTSTKFRAMCRRWAPPIWTPMTTAT